jgi:hypothetical protein
VSRLIHRVTLKSRKPNDVKRPGEREFVHSPPRVDTGAVGPGAARRTNTTLEERRSKNIMVKKFIGAVLGVVSAVGVIAQPAPAQACLSGLETAWTRENICSDEFSTGSSQGILSPYAIQANLIFGSLAIAGGFDAGGQPVPGCAAADQSAGDGPSEPVECDELEAVQHNIQVNG